MVLRVERTLNDIAGSLLVAIPLIWVRSHGLKAHDKVEVQIFEDHLRIVPLKGLSD